LGQIPESRCAPEDGCWNRQLLQYFADVSSAAHLVDSKAKTYSKQPLELVDTHTNTHKHTHKNKHTQTKTKHPHKNKKKTHTHTLTTKSNILVGGFNPSEKK
jgi:hypothetical protein